MFDRLRLIAFSFAVLVAVTTGNYCHAQDGQAYDEALDRYEAICNRCLEMRNSASWGFKVSASEFNKLLNELSSLRNAIMGASGEMSDSQRGRFNRIRNNYLSGRFSNTSGIPFIPDDSRMTPLGPAIVAHPLPEHLLKTETDYTVPPAPGQVHCLLSLSVWPEISYGAMLLYKKSRFGGYLRGGSAFNFTRADYGFDPESGEGGAWMTGKKKVRLNYAFAGVSYWLAESFGLYAGAGYAERELLWEDSGLSWAKIESRSFSGFSADAGALVSLGRFTIGAGIMSIRTDYFLATVSAGIRF